MKQPDIRFDIPSLSAEQIDARQDFGKVLSGYKATQLFYKSVWFWSAMGVGLIGMALLLTFNSTRDTATTHPLVQTETPSSSRSPQIAVPHGPAIQPPSEHLQIAFDHYELDADEGGSIEHRTGSLISFPKNAFVDANGHMVHGPVEIKYREFHDPLDVWISGIPMDYDSAFHQRFESAGMGEIRAFKDGSPLSLAPGKEMAIEMVSFNDNPAMNFYTLSDSDGTWSYQGKDEITLMHGAPAYAEPRQGVSPEVLETMEAYNSATQQLEEMAETAPRAVQKNAYTFDLDLDLADYPELAKFQNVIFEVMDRDFDPAIYEVAWEDAKLEQHGKQYVLQLLSAERRESVRVRPALTGKELERAIRDYEGKRANKEAQVKALEEQLNELETATADDMKAHHDAQKAVWEADYNEQKAADQAKLGMEERLRRQGKALKTLQNLSYTPNTKAKSAKLKNLAVVTRNITSDMLGVFNFDLGSFAFPKGRNPKYKDNGFGDEKPVRLRDRLSGAFIVPALIFLVEKTRNLIYQFNREGQETFSFNPDAQNVMWAMTKDGRIAVFRAKDFENLAQQSDVYELEVEVCDDILDTKEALASFLGLDNPG